MEKQAPLRKGYRAVGEKTQGRRQARLSGVFLLIGPSRICHTPGNA